MKRKTEAMYSLFGHSEGKCRDCSNFVKFCYRTKNLQKCSVYGKTRSESSDWVGKWEACGMFNKDYNGRPIMEIRKQWSEHTDEQIEGQMSLEDFI